MQLTIATVVVFLAVACAVAAWLLSRAWAAGARTGLDGFGALVTFIAVVLGSYWYLDRRPDAPKMNLAIAGDAIRLGEHDALVNIDLTVSNVGLSALDFNGETIDVYVQQVTPLIPEMRTKLYDDAGVPLDRIDSNYLWAALRHLKHPYTARIEAGETDHYYFRTVVRCEPAMVVLLQARVPKDPHGIEALSLFRSLAVPLKNGKWIVQSVLDLGEACPAKGARK